MRVFWRQIKLIHRFFSKAHIKITQNVKICGGVSLLKTERMTVKSLKSRGLVHCKALLADFWLKFCECKNRFMQESHYMWAPVLIAQQELFCKTAIFYCLGGLTFSAHCVDFLLVHDCSRQRIAAPSFCVLSLFIGCDLRHDSLWAFLCSNGKKKRFLWIENCLFFC